MNIIPFNFDTRTIRSTLIDGAPWFVAKDVCDVLELRVDNSVRSLDDDEKGITHLQGFARGATIVSESGLYSLILRSRKPEARAFKKWMTSDVLPTIRKTGAYGLPDAVVRYFDDLTERLMLADKEVEHKTRHDYYTIGRGEAKRDRTVAEVAAKFGLDPRHVVHANRHSAVDVLADLVGDPRAIETRKRTQESLASIALARAPAALEAPRKRVRASRPRYGASRY